MAQQSRSMWHSEDEEMVSNPSSSPDMQKIKSFSFLESKHKVRVLYGGLEEIEETCVSLPSALDQLRDKFDTTYHRVDKRLSLEELRETLSLDSSSEENIDDPLVFIGFYGNYAVDGDLVQQLDELNVSYTGSEASTCRLAYDRVIFKQWCVAAGLSTPPFQVLKAEESVQDDIWDSPRLQPLVGEKIVVKPARQGLREAISYVNWYDTPSLRDAIGRAFAKDQSRPSASRVILEKHINGRDLLAGVVAGAALPDLVEVELKDKSKPLTRDAEFEVKVVPGDPLRDRLSKIAVKTFQLIGGCDYGRLDVVYDSTEDQFYILKLSTRPDLYCRLEQFGNAIPKTSVLVQAYKSGFKELCQVLLELAASRKIWKRFRRYPKPVELVKTFSSTSSLLSDWEQHRVFRVEELSALLYTKCFEKIGRSLDNAYQLNGHLVSEDLVALFPIIQQALHGDLTLPRDIQEALQGNPALANDIWLKIWRTWRNEDSSVDGYQLHCWLKGLVRSLFSSKQYFSAKEEVRKVFSAVLAAEHPFIYSFFTELANVDIFELVFGLAPRGKRETNRGPIEGADDLRVKLKTCIEWNSILCSALQDAFASWSNLDSRCAARVREGTVKQAVPHASPSHQVYDFEGAGLPKARPGVKAFMESFNRCTERHLQTQPYGTFVALWQVFEHYISRLFGKDVVAYPTRGTYSSFRAAFARRPADSKFFIATPCEYPPMVDYIIQNTTTSPPLFADIRHSDFSVEKIAEKLVQAASEAGISNQVCIVLVSSCLRMGGRYFDMLKLRRLLDLDVERTWCLWIDASQDHRVFNCGSITWYSKRFTCSGAGMVVVRKDPALIDHESAFSIQSGYETGHLVHLCKSLEESLSNIDFRFSDMGRIPALWDASTHRHGICTLLRQAEHEINKNGLAKLFRLEYNEKEFIFCSSPMRGAVVRFIPNHDLGEKIIDLVLYLKNKGFECESFSLWNHAGFDQVLELKETTAPPAWYQPMTAFLRRHRDRLVWFTASFDSLPCTVDEGFELEIENVIKLHNYLRLFISPTDNHLIDFIRHARDYLFSSVGEFPSDLQETVRSSSSFSDESYE